MMSRRVTLLFSTFIALFLVSFNSSAQLGSIKQHAKWTVDASRKEVAIGEEVDIIFQATVDEGWYLYASDFDTLCGPIVATFKFQNVTNYALVGGIKSINSVAKYDEAFGCDVKIFKHHGEFRQRVRITGKPVVVTCSFEGQTCQTNGSCVQASADLAFEGFNISGKPLKQTPQNKNNVGEPNNETKPVNATVDTAKTSTTAVVASPSQYGKDKGPIIDPSILPPPPQAEKESLWGYMILAFILGLTSLITPCVFPMIPMTVTFFLKDGQSKKEGVRKAIFFGTSIVAIYTIVGTAFAVIFGAEGLNALATHWLPNLLIFVIFIIFALSFLGLFEITAPHQLVNKADRAAEKGGWVGIFFMSATLVLVSFSCTIPLVGNVLVLAAGGEVVKPILGMFAYSLAFAIPFTLFAFFPEWLKGLPKSGGWLNTVKVSLGLAELALALKFFSIADQTYHWGLLDRDINIGIWIVIASFLGLYFLGKIKLPSDSPVDKITVPRLMLSIATFSFVVYLIPGLWGAPLKGLAGYLPPQYTHDFDLVSLAEGSRKNELCEEPKHADFLHLPHGLQGYFDYHQALACARQQNKPLFIDFTGHGCTNCREMEAVVWSDPQVLMRLQNDFVVVALYVDDKTKLPENEWYTSKVDNKVKQSIGKQNADLEIANLNNNAQPYYVLVGKDERIMAWPRAYNRSVQEFVKFLDEGKVNYNKMYK